MKYFGKRAMQSYIEKFVSIMLCVGIIFAGILLSSCQCKNFFILPSDKEIINVIVEYERHEDLTGIYKIDIVIPKIDAGGQAIKTLNETIRDEFMEYYKLNGGNASEILGGWKYPQITISYKVVRSEPVFAISVITEIHSEEDQGEEVSVQNYYYDEAGKKILSAKEYLEKIGLTTEDITHAFLKGAGQDYNIDQVDFSSLQNHFYMDEKKQPVFFVSD